MRDKKWVGQEVRKIKAMDLLQQQIEALLPEKLEEHEKCDCSDYRGGQRDGFNESLSLCKQSLPKIIELIEKDTREKIEKKLMRGFDELESNDIDKSMEQWKNYKFIRNNIRDIIN